MPTRRPVLLLALVAALGAATNPCASAPRDIKQYTMAQGGMLDIPEGSVVEGSMVAGGLQPDYVLDLQSRRFRPLLKFAREVGVDRMPFWKKIEAISRHVNNDVFKKRAYDDKDYRHLLDKYRELERNIPLSCYLTESAGVCREYALVTHFMLKAAGIPSRHVYATIRQGEKTEDHAFVVVRHEGEDWIVDPYNQNFHGFLLGDAMSLEGIISESRCAPVAAPEPGFRRVVRINDFPKVWMPKNASTELARAHEQRGLLKAFRRSCERLFGAACQKEATISE